MDDFWPADSYSQTALNTWSQSPYFAQAGSIAQNHGINPSVFQAIIGSESGFNPSATNGDAVGIAQFMPSTAQQYGVNRYDPTSSLAGAATYYGNLLQQCNGDYICASTKYGTLPTGGNLTQNQQLLLQMEASADKANGLSVSVAGAPSGSPLQNMDACGTYDYVCKVRQWVAESAANGLTIVAGLILLIVGLVMLKNNVSPGAAVNIVAGHAKNGATKIAKLAA